MNIKQFNSKGDMSINTVVAAAIALLVLIVMIMIFSDNIGNSAGKLKDVGDNTVLNGCPNLVLGRSCENSCAADKVVTEYNAWCKDVNNKQGDKTTCCQK